MFWIAFIVISLSWVLTKFGALSATVGILTLVIKVLVLVILIGAVATAGFWLRKKISKPAGGQ